MTQIMLTREEIGCRVRALGKLISERHRGEELICVCVLKGAVVFFADLIREIEGQVRLDFVQVSSYSGTESTGRIEMRKDTDTDIKGKNVLLVEDILDTGLTMRRLRDEFLGRDPASVEICCLLDKPSRRRTEITADYVGFTVPDEFIVGYGLDYDEKYRNLKDVCILHELVE